MTSNDLGSVKKLPIAQNVPQSWLDVDAAQATNAMDFVHLLNIHGLIQSVSEAIAQSGDICQIGSWVVYLKDLVSVST